MFEHTQSEQSLNELRNILFNFYHNKLEQKLDEMWLDGTLNQDKLDKINAMDLHKLWNSYFVQIAWYNVCQDEVNIMNYGYRLWAAKIFYVFQTKYWKNTQKSSVSKISANTIFPFIDERLAQKD